MKNKETSIQWFVSQLPLRIRNSHATEIEKAKQMMEEQISNGYFQGLIDGMNNFTRDYYNETYKQPNNEQ